MSDLTSKTIFVAWDFTTRSLRLQLEALVRRPPDGFVLDVPGLEPMAGEILRSVVLRSLDHSHGVLAIVDKPNANVAFEAGLGIALGKPLALACHCEEIPSWLKRPPFSNLLIAPFAGPGDLGDLLATPSAWFLPPEVAPSESSKREATLFLCPGRSEGEACRFIAREARPDWHLLPSRGFSLLDLGPILSDVARVVWTIAQYQEGADERDGAENASHGAIAGYFFGRVLAEGQHVRSLTNRRWTAGLDALRVLRSQEARSVVDVELMEETFADLSTFERLLLSIRQESPKEGLSPKSEPIQELRWVTILSFSIAQRDHLLESLAAEQIAMIRERLNGILESLASEHRATLFKKGPLEAWLCFGYPYASDNDAWRALRTSEILVRRLAVAPFVQSSIEVSPIEPVIGLHSGTALVIADNEPLGRVVAIVDQVRDRGKAGEILATADCLRDVSRVETSAAGDLRVDSEPRPLDLFTVDAVGQGRGRNGIAESQSPFVGRALQLERIRELSRVAIEGRGNAVLITGEAGIGKSRLVDVFVGDHFSAQFVIFQAQCQQRLQRTPLRPVLDVVDEIERKYDQLGLDHAGELFDVLDAEIAGRGALLRELRTDRRSGDRRLLNIGATSDVVSSALVRLFQVSSDQSPLMIVFEDIQWADPSTTGLLKELASDISFSHIFLVIVGRDEVLPEWQSFSQLHRVQLEPLKEAEIGQIMESLVPQEIAPEIVTEIARRTGGNPFWVEELTRDLVEASVDVSAADAEDVLRFCRLAPMREGPRRRLDRLGNEAKGIARAASVIGREFTPKVLEIVYDGSRDSTSYGLDRLLQAKVLERRGRGRQARYRFHHDNLRDAVYTSIPDLERKGYHNRLALGFSKRFPESAEREPEILAEHLELSGNSAEAFSYWVKAGRYSMDRFGNAEALSHFRHALTAARHLPSSVDLQFEIFRIEVDIGTLLMRVEGYGAPSAQAQFNRILRKAQNVNDAVVVFSAVRGLWGHYGAQARWTKATNLGRKLLGMAEGSPAQLAEAHRTLGVCQLWTGKAGESIESMKRSLGYHGQLHRPLFDFGLEPSVVAKLYLGIAKWYLGALRDSVQFGEAALSDAREFGHPFTLGFATAFGAWLYQLHGDANRTKELAAEAIRVASKGPYLQWGAYGLVFFGWASGRTGESRKGIAQIVEGCERSQEAGVWLGLPQFLALQAGFAMDIGELEEASSLLERALDIARRNRERFFLPEILRLQAQLLVSLGQETQAEAQLQKASAVARRQQAYCFRKAIDNQKEEL